MQGAMPTMDLPIPDAIPPPIPVAARSAAPTPAAPIPAAPVGTPIPAMANATPVRAEAVAAPARRRRAPTLVPGARIGVWRIERELGRGGMATVYSVVHTRF